MYCNIHSGKVLHFSERRDRVAVPYERFWNHVILRHADTNYRFSSEFEKTNLKTVLYDQTSVVLSMIGSVQGSHYINANYVDSKCIICHSSNHVLPYNHVCHNNIVTISYNAMNFYIATQGPLANTISEFWRMVWEQNSRVIVMITNIIEKGRDSTDEAIKPMLVQQFHFTGWPDHGVLDPGYELPVLDFIFKSTAAQVEGAGPIVVHCSAGVGRSGAFIVIDSMIKRIHDNGDIDIFNFLCHIRQQRNHLVQEECQYVFVHDVILEYIQCGFLLSLPKKALKGHLHKLRTQTHSSGKNKITAEYEKLKSIKIQDYNVKDGQKTCNINKNRNTNIIPVDSCRVKLYPRPREEGSDYINASYIDGFRRREAYIATQYPLESTVFDFWRMMWQENCRSIVMLISKEELDKNNFPRYLPVVHDTARFGVYEVTMESESARGDLMIRDLRMTSLNEPGETRRIRHFHFIHWPEGGQPWSGQSILQLVSKVDDWERDVKSKAKPFDMIGPIVVHCSTGGGRTGVYCTLHTLWHQVGREEVVSVYPYARLYFHQRLQFLQTQAQYEFCYDTMVEYIDADCSLYLV
ncbi:hypothetical protein QZH41_015425 [Actinostola sp. cb2023]|nr:hypothetical protein QZH41_015425 [Actinostola sp. cb2023]